MSGFSCSFSYGGKTSFSDISDYLFSWFSDLFNRPAENQVSSVLVDIVDLLKKKCLPNDRIYLLGSLDISKRQFDQIQT